MSSDPNRPLVPRRQDSSARLQGVQLKPGSVRRAGAMLGALGMAALKKAAEMAYVAAAPNLATFDQKKRTVSTIADFIPIIGGLKGMVESESTGGKMFNIATIPLDLFGAGGAKNVGKAIMKTAAGAQDAGNVLSTMQQAARAGDVGGAVRMAEGAFAKKTNGNFGGGSGRPAAEAAKPIVYRGVSRPDHMTTTAAGRATPSFTTSRPVAEAYSNKGYATEPTVGAFELNATNPLRLGGANVGGTEMAGVTSYSQLHAALRAAGASDEEILDAAGNMRSTSWQVDRGSGPHKLNPREALEGEDPVIHNYGIADSPKMTELAKKYGFDSFNYWGNYSGGRVTGDALEAEMKAGRVRRTPMGLESEEWRVFDPETQLAPHRARSAFTAPDLGPEVDAARRGLFDKVREYSMRPGNSAPAGEFGTARLLGKGEYDDQFATRVADEYERAVSNPNDPRVMESYNQFAKEIEEQFDFLTNEMGIKYLPGEADPYADSAEMMRDLFENRQLRVFGGGEAHPMLTPEQNVKFRFVHDVMGHGIYGNSFGKAGEENAFRAHSELFSGNARGAMATETRGQNSWVNFGPHGEANRANPAETRFADQKAVLLPEDMQAPTPAPTPTPDAPAVNAPNVNTRLPQDLLGRVRDRVNTGTGSRRARQGVIDTLDQYLTPEEMASASTPKGLSQFLKDGKGSFRQVANTFLSMPNSDELASTMIAGHRASGWYPREGGAIREAFGDDDAPAFAALAAAMSPQAKWSDPKSDATNLAWALKGWKRWNELGRATDDATIREVIRASDHMLSKGKGGGIGTLKPGVEAALRTPKEQLLDPAIQLLGPKTDMFRKNLMGYLDFLTMDTHEAHRMGASALNPGTVGRNIPARAAFRGGAEAFERITGLPANGVGNGQSMDWSFIQGVRLPRGSNEEYVRKQLAAANGRYADTDIARHIENAPTAYGLMGPGGRHEDLVRAAGGRPPEGPLEGIQVPPNIPFELADPDHLIDAAQRSDQARRAADVAAKNLERRKAGKKPKAVPYDSRYLYAAPPLLAGGLLARQKEEQEEKKRGSSLFEMY